MGHGAMTLDECARRMTRLLAAKPARKVSQQYMKSLPKRERVVVSVAEYDLRHMAKAEAKALGLSKDRDVARYQAWIDSGQPIAPCAPPRVRSRRRHMAHKPLLTRIAKIQDMRCARCGDYLDFGGDIANPLSATYDHVMPRALGGVDHNNRIVMHRFCNQEKASRLPTGCELVWLMAVNAHLSDGFNAPPPPAPHT